MYNNCQKTKSKPVLILGLLWVQFLFLCSVGLSQNGTVGGTVTDAESGDTMPGVNVTVKGTTIGTATDTQGAYSLNVPSLNDTLVFSFIGYQMEEVPINGRTTINASLTPQIIMGSDVVVVGYGTRQSKDITGSVGAVQMGNIESLPITSPDEALIGQIPGVRVTTTSGIPGGGPSIQVRGLGNVGAGGQPLYVVDGFALPQPRDEEAVRYRNPLAAIPPSDIASITVLKDASATAIYGSRASNGVIVITTKSGRANTREINVTASTGIQNDIDWMKIDMASARQFAEFQNYIWSARVAAGEATEVPELYRNPDQYGEGTDWFELIRRKNAPSHQVQVSISGGNETIRAYFSGGVRSDEGIIHNTSFNRINFRANLEADLSDRLQVGLNIAPSYTERSLPDVTNDDGRGTTVGSPLMISPLGPAYDENGNLTTFPSQYYNNGQGSPGTWTHANPLYVLKNLDESFTGVRAFGTAYANYEFIEGLSARTSLNIDWGTSRHNVFSPSTVGAINTPPPVVPEGEIENDRDISFLSETTVSLIRDLGPGTIDAVAGFTVQTGYSFSSLFEGEFPDDEIRTLNVASNITGESDEQEWSMLSYLARVNYNLLDRFVFTGTVRTDGSSRFGEDNRWGTFPSGAIAWNLHNEPFLEGIEDTFPELRLRLSYGLTGNNQIGNYSALGVVNRDDYLFSGSIAGGRRVASLANPSLGWERTKEWNIGLDAALLNYRIRFSIDAYKRTTTDLLLERDLPTSSGFDEVTQNLGSMQNTGVELSISTVNVTGNDFNWSTNFNWSLNRNKILKLPDDDPIFLNGGEGHPAFMTKEGEPIALFIGYLVDGIYTQEMLDITDPNDPNYVPRFDGAVPGNLIWRDYNGDGEINPGPVERGGDFAVIGNPHPDFTFGMTNNLSYRQFDLRVIMTGRLGGDINRREYYRTALNIDGLFNIAADYVENFWRSPEDPGDGRHPTPLGGGEARRRYRGSHEFNIYDGSNIWIRNAMLRYNLPAGFAGIGNSSIYFSVDNPFIFTSYPGNPDVQKNDEVTSLQLGVDYVTYPLARQFTLGVELSF